jgi:hypothetical protein
MSRAVRMDAGIGCVVGNWDLQDSRLMSLLSFGLEARIHSNSPRQSVELVRSQPTYLTPTPAQCLNPSTPKTSIRISRAEKIRTTTICLSSRMGSLDWGSTACSASTITNHTPDPRIHSNSPRQSVELGRSQKITTYIPLKVGLLA